MCDSVMPEGASTLPPAFSVASIATVSTTVCMCAAAPGDIAEPVLIV